MQKKMVILGNCQGPALAKTLLENREFSERYRYEFVKPIQDLSPADIPHVTSLVEQADLLLYQPIHATPRRPKELTTDYLKSKLHRRATAISFPSIYFNGYFPHLDTLLAHKSILNLVHDYVIAYCFVRNLTVEKTIELISRKDLYPSQLSHQLVNTSITNLQHREIDDHIDIPISPYIRSNFRDVKLFNQFNHPKKILFNFVAEQILTTLSIADDPIPNVTSGFLDMIETPIYISTYENLELKFEENFTSYSGIHFQKVSTDLVVAGLFETYRQLEAQTIQNHIVKTKPFVREIVESQM